jgi:acyl dehydratase
MEMSMSKTSGLVCELADLPAQVGRHVGFTDWQVMDQKRVNAFADATEDHQWIHVDVERATASPLGGTIAHGFLTLSLLAPITQGLVTVTDAGTGLNYGLDRVRFPAPLPVGAQWRGGVEVLEVSAVGGGGVQMKIRVTVEVKDSEKPACVAENLVRLYP